MSAGDTPRWSPDGARLVLSLSLDAGDAGRHRSAELFLFSLDADGPRLHRLTEGGGGSAYWLGKGDRLIYEAPDGAGGFQLIQRDEGGIGRARSFWTEEDIPATPLADVVL